MKISMLIFSMLLLLSCSSPKKEKNNEENDSFDPPQPVKITTPESVTSQPLPEDNAFLIEIRKDQSVWYQVISKVSRMTPQKIDPPITTNLKKIVADYDQSLPGVKKTYLIKGASEVNYPVLQQVINALKENNIFKYNLVTSIDQ